jgi:hypothetical protein
MATVCGPGIAFPQGVAANAVLRIDTDIIGQKLFTFLNKRLGENTFHPHYSPQIPATVD